MQRNIVETSLGAFVLIIAFIFLIFAYDKADVKKAKGYHINARFEHADGVSVGTEIRIAGIKVGTISKQNLDPDDFSANLTFDIQKRIKLSTDTSAQIVSDGLLGGKYINLSPGGMDEIIPENGMIKYTQSSINLETLIGKMVFNSANDTSKK